MNQTGSLSNIIALIAFTAITVVLARLQPVAGIDQVQAAEMAMTDSLRPTAELTAAHVTPTRQQADAIRAACGSAHVQYNKLSGYRQCIEQQHVGYDPSAWCPVVKNFCDAQWYPFGDRERCFSERGCPAS